MLWNFIRENNMALNLTQTSRIKKWAQHVFLSYRSNTGFRCCWKTAINFQQREINGFRMYCSPPMEEAWTRKKSGRSLDIPAVPPAGIAGKRERKKKREKERDIENTKRREILVLSTPFSSSGADHHLSKHESNCF